MLTFLGVLGIIVFCVLVIALAAGVTYAVVRFLPSKTKKPKPAAET